MPANHSAFGLPIDLTMRKTLLIISSVAIIALLFACSDENEAASPKAPPATQDSGASVTPQGGAPIITVGADKTHAVQPGDAITVSVAVSGFGLDESKIGQSNEPGVGHYRIYLDEARSDDYLAAGAAPSSKIIVPESITDGTHELRVVLYNNDRTPLSPAVEGSVLLIVYRL